MEDYKNICFLTELINNNKSDFITQEIYNIGENDFIEVDIDITKYLSEYNILIVNIISQELRFEKELNFYKPKIYYFKKNNNLVKNIFFIVGIVLLLIFVCIYFKKIFKKLKKNRKHKKVIYEDNFGLELNDKSDFLNNQK